MVGTIQVDLVSVEQLSHSQDIFNVLGDIAVDQIRECIHFVSVLGMGVRTCSDQGLKDCRRRIRVICRANKGRRSFHVPVINADFGADQLVHYCCVRSSREHKVGNQDVITEGPNVVSVSVQELAHPLFNSAGGNSFQK